MSEIFSYLHWVYNLFPRDRGDAPQPLKGQWARYHLVQSEFARDEQR